MSAKAKRTKESVQEMAARLGIVVPGPDDLSDQAKQGTGPLIGGWVVTLDPTALPGVRDDDGGFDTEMVVPVASADQAAKVLPGDRVFLFVGGRPTKAHAPGLWAFGVARAAEGEARVAFSATWLDPPVSRAELRINPGLARVAAGGSGANEPRALTPEEATDLEAIVGELYDLPA